MFPARFNNKTNGVTPRRWLLMANPALARLITDAIGDGWVADLAQLRGLAPLAGDAAFRERFADAKRQAKGRFVDWLQRTCGLAADPDTIFDSQMKRIHEYKRQLLNVLHIVILYNRMRRDPDGTVTPRTFFFAGKAAPAYSFAKLIIKLINNVAATIDRDPVTRRTAEGAVSPGLQREHGRVADPRERCVRTDLDRGLRSQRHEQHEVHDEWRADGRNPRRRDHRDGAGGWRGQHVPVRPHGRAGRGKPRLVQPVVALRPRRGNAGGARPDRLGSLQPRRARRVRLRSAMPCSPAATTTATSRISTSYADTQMRVAALYKDSAAWAGKAILNVACSGRFSSDRTIAEYAAEIWNTKPCPVP